MSYVLFLLGPLLDLVMRSRATAHYRYFDRQTFALMRFGWGLVFQSAQILTACRSGKPPNLGRRYYGMNFTQLFTTIAVLHVDMPLQNSSISNTVSSRIHNNSHEIANLQEIAQVGSYKNIKPKSKSHKERKSWFHSPSCEHVLANLKHPQPHTEYPIIYKKWCINNSSEIISSWVTYKM